jgi:hypothetical protein
MKASTRALALRAAAKAALSVSLAGCGGALAHATDDSGADPVSTTVSDGGHGRGADGAARAPKEAGSALTVRDAASRGDAVSEPCPGLPEAGDAAVSENTFTCCTSYLSPAADAAFGSLGVDASAPASRACCNAVITYVDQTAGAYAAASTVLPACCQGEGAPEGRACTPWGPPVPPTMPGARAEVA